MCLLTEYEAAPDQLQLSCDYTEDDHSQIYGLYRFQQVLNPIAESRMLLLTAGREQAIAMLCAATLCTWQPQ